MSMIRFCPNCLTERGLHEIFCEGLINDHQCGWDLSREPIRTSGWRPAQVVTVEQLPPISTTIPTQVLCVNGHPMDEGDIICLICGATLTDNSPALSAENSPQQETCINEWRLLNKIAESEHVYTRYHVEHITDNRQATLTLYCANCEPDIAIYNLLKTLPREHVPEIIDAGRWQEQAYVVTERLSQGSLADLGTVLTDISQIRHVVKEVGEALYCFAEAGLRLCDLRPETLLVRALDPIDLVVTDFGSARLSEFDLDIISPLKSSYYTAPEAIAGGVSISSDWWSFGIILLEQITQGKCFDNINPQAFMIHVLTHGITLPDDLSSEIQLLLRGLLAKDHHQRWQWQEVKAWLNGEPVSAPEMTSIVQDAVDGIAIELNQQFYRKPALFALAAAEQKNWAQGQERLLNGSLLTWLMQIEYDAKRLDNIRQIQNNHQISDEFKWMLTLKILNQEMPLVYQGDIVSSSWLIQHPIEGYQLISGEIPAQLRQLETENWLWQLHERIEKVTKRARDLDVILDPEITKIHLLSTSRAQLLAQWQDRWQLFPDASHAGLLSLMERAIISNEDLIILLSSPLSLFRSVDSVTKDVLQQVKSLEILTFESSQIAELILLPRPQLYQRLNETIAGFAKTGYNEINHWVAQYRLEKRLPLSRLLLILCIEKSQWLQPEKHQYITDIIDYFSKKVTTSIMLGPLVRMKIGQSTSRVDLFSLGTDSKPANDIINHLLARTAKQFRLDPVIFATNYRLGVRLTNLQNQCQVDFRDTGVNGLYLGFPFLYYKEPQTNRLPRIAPIFLWPVNITSEISAQHRISLAFDNQREEVRINPALEQMLGKTVYQKLLKKRDELLSLSTLTQQDVMTALQDIGQRLNQQLSPLQENIEIKDDQLFIDCTAVLFNVNFTGQVIGEELRLLKQLSPMNTGLETALRLNQQPQMITLVDKPTEVERFLTAASDPSQENAIFKARQAPGLLMEGPPGTGKSQTIVNMVADAIGCKKTLLIICQKKAAIDVVYKRLVAENLSNRCLMINNINSDRQPIINSIREQVNGLLRNPDDPQQTLQNQREKQANQISAIEQRLDDAYLATHHINEQIGLSYRQIISELIELENSGPCFSAPLLRRDFAELNLSQLESLENECVPIIRYWLLANYQQNPLSHLKHFAHDEATIREFTRILEQFLSDEQQRLAILTDNSNRFDVEDIEVHQQWIKHESRELLSISESLRETLNQWLMLFNSDSGERILRELEQCLSELQPLQAQPWHEMSIKVSDLSEPSLAKLAQQAATIASPTSWLSIFNFKRHYYQRNITKTLNSLGVVADSQTIRKFLQALQLEQRYRPIRLRVQTIYQQLKLPMLPNSIGHLIADDIRQRITELIQVQHWSQKLARVTRREEVEQALLTSRAAVKNLLDEFEIAFIRCASKNQSISSLCSLQHYINDELQTVLLSALNNHQATPNILKDIVSHMSELSAYQYFRTRSQNLSNQTSQLLTVLHNYRDQLLTIPEQALEQTFRQLINIEARLAWKYQLEQNNPMLLADYSEQEQQIDTLNAADQIMRDLNRDYLSQNISRPLLGNLLAWEAITRLTGRRALRLREFIEQALPIGLMNVRPVWLMTPDIASQILPLKAGLFDVVIYDEASQMPIEYALPTLYRAKNVIVSGDEKQMPPTSFFSTQMQQDEDESPDLKLSYEEMSDKEQLEQTNDWDRREITNCPDLLQLARSVLPSTTLAIHYRSNYRELINFSNRAFYANQLNVPVRHSKEVLASIKPIELIHIEDGIYQEQSNVFEARRVLAEVEKLWRVDEPQRPTIGVVTFNKKQAELIQSLFTEKMILDDAFRAVYTEQLNRNDNGEDISFFIKNVENVQGDERDIILFSTTFGRNESGVFRRNFGVLGQQGGERRLNVAVTRAKNRMIIITSMPINDISDMLDTQRAPLLPRDYLQFYLEYARTLTESQWQQNEALLARIPLVSQSIASNSNNRRDGFLDDVARFLDSLDIAYDEIVGSDLFSLAFAIKDPLTNLYQIGIECDPPYNPLLENARAREIWRLNVLKRSIPHIYRISSATWFEQKSRVQQELKQFIQQIYQGEQS